MKYINHCDSEDYYITNDSIDLGVRYDVSDYNKLELNDLRDPDLFKVLGRAFVVVRILFGSLGMMMLKH
ncbi:hypothetical protein ACRS3H_30010 [Pseudomonas aeruginosa]|uniref:hypothetical protein n=1 Tax=Pseudomonas aeruginosa TaxID=287 RepID=UPI003EDF5077